MTKAKSKTAAPEGMFYQEEIASLKQKLEAKNETEYQLLNRLDALTTRLDAFEEKEIIERDKKKAADKEVKRRPLEIVNVVNSALFRIVRKGGGEIPEELKGESWTTVQKAKDAIDSYVQKNTSIAA